MAHRLALTDLHGSVADPILDTMNFLNEVTARYPDAVSFAPGRPFDGLFDPACIAELLRQLHPLPAPVRTQRGAGAGRPVPVRPDERADPRPDRGDGGERRRHRSAAGVGRGHGGRAGRDVPAPTGAHGRASRRAAGQFAVLHRHHRGGPAARCPGDRRGRRAGWPGPGRRAPRRAAGPRGRASDRARCTWSRTSPTPPAPA